MKLIKFLAKALWLPVVALGICAVVFGGLYLIAHSFPISLDVFLTILLGFVILLWLSFLGYMEADDAGWWE